MEQVLLRIQSRDETSKRPSIDEAAEMIEDVVNKRILSTRHSGNREFLVKWCGHFASDCTWIIVEEFLRVDPGLLEQYYALLSRRQIFKTRGK
ncbi:hypothetical protein RJ640_000460 [Escallonia rubra]|uniref:Chromo domain-containing protein n=1 Tax=Escallonia rubra TaxID=112253 RepID=A0AA88U5Y2_9ASTE|nr:hypothetical protein RJ640_000460 [Escallonia rubra]